jgi:hypothetical protein
LGSARRLPEKGAHNAEALTLSPSLGLNIHRASGAWEVRMKTHIPGDHVVLGLMALIAFIVALCVMVEG